MLEKNPFWPYIVGLFCINVQVTFLFKNKLSHHLNLKGILLGNVNEYIITQEEKL